MENDNPTSNNQTVQDLQNQLNGLLDEAKKVSQEIEEESRQSKEEMSVFETGVDESTRNVEQIYSDLDQIEKEAGDEIDKLILEQSEALAKE